MSSGGVGQSRAIPGTSPAGGLAPVVLKGTFEMRSVLALLALTAGACAANPPAQPPIDDPETLEPLPEPALIGMSKDRIAVGEELGFEGTGFVNDERGYTTITFRGRFLTTDGSVENVDLTIAPEIISEVEARWAQFGPYRVPFVAAGNETGTFEGRVFATNVSLTDAHGEAQATPIDATIDVLPSLVVRELQPEGAACAIVAESALNLLPYRVQVEAVGFTPAHFRYVLSPGAISDPASIVGSVDELVLDHPATGQVDALAENERPRFAEVPYGLQAYRGSISVRAEEEDGTVHELQVRMTVRRPLQVGFHAAIQPAQIYEPVPVSGCIPGGSNGRGVNYSESHSEVRERSMSIGWSQDWESTYTQGHSENYTEGGSESNRVGFSTADGSNWSWNVNGEVYGEGGVSLIAEGKAGFKVGGGVGGGGTRETTNSRDREWEQSHSFGEAVEESTAISAAEGASGTESWTVSSEDSHSLQFEAFLLPNHFGTFYRQTTRLVRAGDVVAYDLCGVAIPVGQLTLDDYTWAPELAISTECPPFPESTFPEAQCLLPPCEE